MALRISRTPLVNGPEVLSSASDKAKLFAKNLSMNSNLDDSDISLSVCPSTNNLKQQNIDVTLKMVKRVKMNLDSSKAFGTCCFPVVFQNCQSELSYTLAELFNMSERALFSRLLEGLISGSCI